MEELTRVYTAAECDCCIGGAATSYTCRYVPLRRAIMFQATVRSILTRELRALQREVEAYPDDMSLWTIVPGISNSGGTLVLHLTSNLRYFIGAILGDTGFVRDREAEFSSRELTRAQLFTEIEDTVRAVDATLARITLDQLGTDYPIPVAARTFRTQDFLLHLVSHLSYHLGQVDYHRRMVTGEAGKVGAVSLAELLR